jgi:hypothetical protein
MSDHEIATLTLIVIFSLNLVWELILWVPSIALQEQANHPKTSSFLLKQAAYIN